MGFSTDSLGLYKLGDFNIDRQDIDNLMVQEIASAGQIKSRANKLINKLFPRPWWRKEKKEFSSRMQNEILNFVKSDMLPSEILTRLDAVEQEIKRVL